MFLLISSEIIVSLLFPLFSRENRVFINHSEVAPAGDRKGDSMGTIKEAKPNQNLTLDAVKVTDKGAVREFSRNGKLGQVCTCKIKDASGEMDLTLWGDESNAIEKGDTISLTDGWCKEWNGNLQASTGKNGKIAKK